MSWETFLLNLRAADIADVLVVTLLLYFILLWLRRRTSRTGAYVSAALVALYIAARLLNMYLTLLIFQVGVGVILIALIVVFQQDIRNWFERVSSWRYPRNRARKYNPRDVIDPLAEAILALAEKRVGALIVLKGRQPIDLYTRGGIRLEGRISVPLLYTLFTPGSPAHDGAVVVIGERIDSFAVHLPLSKNLKEVGRVGTRHTAALGLAECCDALVIAVSEERGTISAAEDGHLRTLRSAAELDACLDAFYTDRFPVKLKPGWYASLFQHGSLKLLAFTLATLLWFFLAFNVEVVQRPFEAVPIEYRNIPPDWIIEDELPAKMRITLAGSERAFKEVDNKSLKVSIDLRDIGEGDNDIVVSEQHLNLPSGLTVRSLESNVISFQAFPTASAEVAVEPYTIGMVPPPLVLEGIDVKPRTVTLLVPRRERDQFKHIRTEVINLSDIRQTTTQQPRLLLPPRSRFPELKQPPVEVTIRVKPVSKEEK
jgi:uncharacterized protein (TIGR00159 family)